MKTNKIPELLKLGADLYGFAEIHGILIELGYNYLSFRRSGRPSPGSECIRLDENEIKVSAENIKVLSVFYPKKYTLSTEQTIVIKTNEGYFEYFKMQCYEKK